MYSLKVWLKAKCCNCYQDIKTARTTTVAQCNSYLFRFWLLLALFSFFILLRTGETTFLPLDYLYLLPPLKGESNQWCIAAVHLIVGYYTATVPSGLLLSLLWDNEQDLVTLPYVGLACMAIHISKRC